MNVVNERSSAILTMNFYDSAGALQAPSSIDYRIDCPEALDNPEVRPWTAIAPAPSIDIRLYSSDTAVKNSTRIQEEHVVTVRAKFGGSDEDMLTDEFSVMVRNLRFV